MKNKLKLLALAVAVGMGSMAHASTVTYVLDQTNVSGFNEPGNFGTVTIEDGVTFAGDTDAVKFTVDVNNDVLKPSNSRYNDDDAFGVRQFGFNLNGITLPNASTLNSIFRLPTIFDPATYDVTRNATLDGFGGFAVVDRTFSDERVVDPLVFYIVGVSGDTINSYIASSTGSASQGHALFAAQVVGFKAVDDGHGGYFYREDSSDETNGYFATSVGSQPLPVGQPPAGVPLPGAVWMFGAGLMGLLRLIRRQSTAV